MRWANFFYRHQHPRCVAKEEHYKIRAGARASTKAQERALVEKAEKLLGNPDLAFPECRGSCWFCDFKSGRSSLEKVREAAEDQKKLERLTESGNEFAKAYAALLLLRKQGKVPYLFSVKTPFGEITYAIRGTAKKERLIAMQQFDNPKARLVGVLDLVRDKKLHFFALEEKMLCTGKESRPPREFVEYLVGQLKASLEKHDGAYMCRHLREEARTDKAMISVPFIDIIWEPAGTRFRICEKCARPGENTLLTILTNMAIPDPREDFRFESRGGFECQSACESCLVPSVELEKETTEKYLHGELDDKGLIDKQTMKCLKELREGSGKIFVLGKKCFGKNLKAFTGAMNPTEEERIGLEAILRKVKGPVVVEGETASKMLETFWDEHATEALEAVCGDPEVAAELLERYKGGRVSPSQILKEALVVVRQKQIIAHLPSYKKLPPVAKFADGMARIYFTRGKEDTARAIERYTTEEFSVKATGFAFLLAMGLNSSKEWFFMKEEQDFATYLKPMAQKFLASTPENYHVNLQELLNATGSTEKITPEP
jgi:hypothetical protein